MTETAQPGTAAESEVASDPIGDAANAFRTFDDQAPDRPRGPDGKFISTAAEDAAEIEAEDEEQPQGDAESDAESHEDEEETDEAADEAQPEAVDLPPSWPSELAEEWSSLPAPLQDKIVQREAEREAAVNAKFQEAANVRKANEAVVTEAQANRQRFAEAADFVLSLVQPQDPPVSMLDPQSGDYNPDAYHLAKARADEARHTLSTVYQQRSKIAQQTAEEEEQQAAQFRAQVEEKFGPLLLKDAPVLADAEKAPQAMGEIVRYAVENGVPEETFTDEARRSAVTSADLRFVWKAMQYDKMMAAKDKVQPKAPKPAAPPVRPGVTTSRSAVEATNRKKNMDRLARSGSIEDAAAIFKTAFKG